MPEHLTWFKWKILFHLDDGLRDARHRVLSGRADLFLVERPERARCFSAPVAMLISLACLAGGWIVYDLLCRWLIGQGADTGLMILLNTSSWCSSPGG